ncbi:MAG: hypothetical protein VR71_20090 [Roseovarius sp. BRH_c41]|nr:MAG: hypothetical protein VR71_20090 [Roseovarius sp. BRH_c41]
MRPNDGAGMSIDSIKLYANTHAIESEQFTLVFRSPLDSADEGRFDERRPEIEELFRAIDEPDVFQVMVGEGPQPPKPVIKVLNDFGRNGKPEWSGQFGENAVSVSSMQYTNWAEIWPSVQNRLKLLLNCVDTFKFVGSIDYKVTDTFTEKVIPNNKGALLSKNILKKGNWVPEGLLSYEDPRWDFSSGLFHSPNERSEVLERVEARSFLTGDQVVTSISNTFSLRLKAAIRLKDLLEGGNVTGRVTETFEDFHDKNKVTIRSIFVNDLLKRMGLGQ